MQHFVETKGPELVESAKDAAGDAIGKVKRKGSRHAGDGTEIARPEDV